MSKARAGTANPVVTDILKQKASFDVKFAELVGTDLESNQNTHDVGAGSYGAFQIQMLKGRNVTPAQAENPAFATRYMKSAYEAAVKKVGPALFKSNPALAAEEAADLAEKPKYDYYKTQGTKRVDEAFNVATGELANPAYTLAADNITADLYGKSKKLPTISTSKLQPLETAWSTDIYSQNKYAKQNAAKAAKALYGAGARGEDLLLGLATFGAETNGTYEGNILGGLPLKNGKLTDTQWYKGGDYYSKAAYTGFLSSALDAAKGYGVKLPTGKQAESLPGYDSPGSIWSTVGSTVKSEAGDVGEAAESIPHFLGELASPDFLIKAIIVIVAIGLILAGIAKMTGASLPRATITA